MRSRNESENGVSGPFQDHSCHPLCVGNRGLHLSGEAALSIFRTEKKLQYEATETAFMDRRQCLLRRIAPYMRKTMKMPERVG